MATALADGRIKVHGIEIELTRKGKGAPLLLLHGGSGPTPNAPLMLTRAILIFGTINIRSAGMGTRHWKCVPNFSLKWRQPR